MTKKLSLATKLSFKEDQLILFVRLLKLFSLLVITGSAILLLVPKLRPTLPTMNLFFTPFGHNQVVSILFFSFPLILFQFLRRKNILNCLLFTAYCFTFFASYSRGAMLLLGLYLIYKTLQSVLNKRTLFIPLFFVTTVTFLSITLMLTNHLPKALLNIVPIQYLIKTNVTTTRFEYWQQAFSAFKEYPLFGYGPGTFNLISKRYQTAPNHYSTFAHSFFFEILSETGIVGILLWGSLLFLIIKLITSRQSTINNQQLTIHYCLLEGLLLTFLYAQIDFSFNYLLVWLLFWATLGKLSAVSLTGKF